MSAGLLVRLRKQPFKPPLPSIFLTNARSITHKMDELELQLATNRLVRNCCAMIITETWLHTLTIRTHNPPAGQKQRLGCAVSMVPWQESQMAKRGEANYLPNLPGGHDETSLENARMVLVEEMKKKQPNGTLISQMMDQSFPLHRQEIVKKEPVVQTMVERWPARFTERQVFAEFNRIASKNLEGDLFEALDQYAPRFIELFKKKKKKGTVSQKLRELMQHMSWMTPDVTVLRSVVLKGIPVLLSDDSSEFYNTCSDTARNEALECITVGVLTVVSEDSPHEVQSSVDLQPIYTAIILEGGIVMDQAASGSLSVVWVYICIAFGLPKMHGKYTQLHSDCDAWTGKEKTPTKTVNSEEQSSGLEQ